jgi:hypothetical protein
MEPENRVWRMRCSQSWDHHYLETDLFRCEYSGLHTPRKYRSELLWRCWERGTDANSLAALPGELSWLDAEFNWPSSHH